MSLKIRRFNLSTPGIPFMIANIQRLEFARQPQDLVEGVRSMGFPPSPQ
jgi:hypothetical protein